MAEPRNWSFPTNLQPKKGEFDFDLEAVLASMVLVHAEVPEDAFTASILGTERVGNGVVIRDDGLVLTIGYVITEAQTLWLTSNEGAVVPGHALAYDQVTGFGLVLPLARLSAPALPRGTVRTCPKGARVLVAGHGGAAHSLKARVIDKREFAGYWEYVLDEAVFTAPAHPQWGGTAMIGEDGHLLGIGSLLVEEKSEGASVEGNMIVPIDLLEPILDEMVSFGRPSHPPRPWLGMYTTEVNGHLVVGGLARGAPADRAGIKVGDVVLGVAGQPPTGLADLFRKIWRVGPAGAEIRLTIGRDGAVHETTVRSADRNDFLKKPRLH